MTTSCIPKQAAHTYIILIDDHDLVNWELPLSKVPSKFYETTLGCLVYFPLVPENLSIAVKEHGLFSFSSFQTWVRGDIDNNDRDDNTDNDNNDHIGNDVDDNDNDNDDNLDDNDDKVRDQFKSNANPSQRKDLFETITWMSFPGFSTFAGILSK